MTTIELVAAPTAGLPPAGPASQSAPGPRQGSTASPARPTARARRLLRPSPVAARSRASGSPPNTAALIEEKP